METKFYRYDGSRHFNIKKFDTAGTGEFADREEAVNEFIDNLLYINKAQQKLYAEKKEGVIFIFQAMDAAGKDGVIRTVFSTLTPHGVKEFCFKVPSSEEKSHDFLWRFWSALPAKGFISIFNRSYYEDVLVGKVHELYKNDLVPDRMKKLDIITERYYQIKDYERYLYNTGTRIIKIFLNVSKDEQARRFISRIDTQKKNWKVSSGDLKEREYWDKYMDAFEDMVNNTSTKDSPWYVVPADHKWFARLLVSRIVRKTLEDIDPHYPELDDDTFNNLQAYREKLVETLPNHEVPAPVKQLTEFSNPGLISADLLQQDELKKIAEQEKATKASGFTAVKKLLDKSYLVHSMDDIMKAIADEETPEAPASQDDEATPTAKEIRKHLRDLEDGDGEDE